MNNLLTTVTLESARRKKDRSVTLTFNTQLEQSSEQFMQMDNLLNDAGVLYFKSNGQLTKEEIKELDNVELEVEGKTKGQRLRNVLYVLWEQTTQMNDNMDFNNFYANKMEEVIEHFKGKLENN